MHENTGERQLVTLFQPSSLAPQRATLPVPSFIRAVFQSLERAGGSILLNPASTLGVLFVFGEQTVGPLCRRVSPNILTLNGPAGYCVRRALGVDSLRAEHDVELPGFRIGFTYVVKPPSANAAELNTSDFEK